ncbi:hypothetical protein SISNIDRAFT_92649 [Sistotremastrum niveocremeum HHB9708]|uniref:Uncharacterized protein n=1 Tax=Sistotremastrum niveocremeum HHB9708 TaxID=1314777 RepID=A0A164U786_9AGAM|nr:hypothetical protein SISNIDRAFT_92649 [Sistotremastrum niveocremeum HHB9708]
MEIGQKREKTHTRGLLIFGHPARARPPVPGGWLCYSSSTINIALPSMSSASVAKSIISMRPVSSSAQPTARPPFRAKATSPLSLSPLSSWIRFITTRFPFSKAPWCHCSTATVTRLLGSLLVSSKGKGRVSNPSESSLLPASASIAAAVPLVTTSTR